MSSIELQVKNRTPSGAIHLQLKSLGDELGLLYLTTEQYNEFVKILRAGCFNKEVDLLIDDPYNGEEDEEGKQLSSFFAID
jgi:hypothetical protein